MTKGLFSKTERTVVQDGGDEKRSGGGVHQRIQVPQQHAALLLGVNRLYCNAKLINYLGCIF